MAPVGPESIEHNADHPFEREAVAGLSAFLERNSWDFSRLPISVDFVLLVDLASRTRVRRVKMIDGAPSGTVEVAFNRLFIQQRPKEFFQRVVPHETAHVISQVEAIARGESIEAHGAEWVEVHHRLTSLEPAPHRTFRRLFDDTPIRLARGAIPALCPECPDSLSCFNDSELADLAAGQKQCDKCGGAKRRADLGELHPDVITQTNFVRFYLED